MIRSIELGHDHGFVALLLIPFAELDAHNLGTHVRRPCMQELAERRRT